MPPPPDPPSPLTAESRVRLAPLTVHREPSAAPLLGGGARGCFLEVDEDTLAAVEAIGATETLGQAAARLRDRDGEDYDVVALVARLRERGMVAEVDGRAEPGAGAAPGGWRPWAGRAPAQWAWARHPAWAAATAALVLGWLAVLATHPAQAPRLADLVLHGRPGLSAGAAFLGLVALALVHELAHYAVARSYGVDASIRVGRRLAWVVLETDVTGAWTQPARRRLAIFLAGPAFNLAFVAVAGLAAAGTHLGTLPLPPGAEPPLRFAAALGLVPVVFQALVFLRTDLYFALQLALRERNLAGDAADYLRFRLARRVHWRGRRAGRCGRCRAWRHRIDPWCPRCGAPRPGFDPRHVPFSWARRRRLLAYGLVLVAGNAAALALFAFRGLPLATGAALEGARAFREAWSAGDPGTAADAALLVAAAAVPLAVVAVLLVQGTRSWSGRVARRVARRRAAGPAGAADRGAPEVGP